MNKKLLFLFLPLMASLALCQDRLPTMPRYDRYNNMRSEIFGSIRGGSVLVEWASNGDWFLFQKDGKEMKYTVSTHATTEATQKEEEEVQNQRQNPQAGRAAPQRGRQYAESFSPDGSMKAFNLDRNVWISKQDGTGAVQVTTKGNPSDRTKFGQASWVYGEELDMREAMWWSPDGKKLAYYGFDESKVPDYYVLLNQVYIQDKVDVEAYPKAGVPNPVVTLFVYDLASKKSSKIDTALNDPSVGEYVYDVKWSPDGKELLYNRTNRHQNHLQFVAADPLTGKCRVIVDENWSKTWTENHPPIEWLPAKSGHSQQFLWISERNGFRNIYLGDISGSPLKPITKFNFEVQEILAVDEPRQEIYFMARDGENPYKLQLHKIKIDGTGEERLTDPHLSHSVQLAPDQKHFVDVEQDLTTPPSTVLCDDHGKVLETLAATDDSRFKTNKLKKAERLVFKAADGVTDLYGYVTFPSDFDPSKKYPVLVSVYGGPASGTTSEHFVLPSPITEMGFLVAWFDGRGTAGRGRAFEDAIYDKLGMVEIDDQAAGAKYLASRPYVDGAHIGIFGTSYGGYASAMCLLRHPEVFHAAVAASPVTDWRNYDSIYTERYMGMPTDADNLKGYEMGTAANYAKDLNGKLMLYYGTADNNVHPSNTLQLVQALQRAGKSFDLMVRPDEGHSGPDANRMWEYFVDNLILAK
ncbi:MAG TPA: DPP IV N-terminal domain-containing protein [Fimbriimonadaceae bacterium]|jgi:dipeptidyl-peptidase-4